MQTNTAIVRNSIVGIASQTVVKVISFAFIVLVVRKLGDAHYGQYSAIMAYVAIFSLFSDLGLAPFAVRAIARDQAAAVRLFSNIVCIRLILSPITIALISASAVFAGYPETVVIGMFMGSLVLVLYAVQGPLEVILTANERLDLVSGLGVLNQLLFVALGMLLLVSGYGYYGLLGASLFSLTITTVVTALVVRRMFGLPLGRVIPGDWPQLIRQAIPFGIMGFTALVLYRVDTVLLSILRSDVEVAWYSIGYNFVFMLMFVANSINSALYPSLARQLAHDPQAIGPLVRKVTTYLVVISLPLSVVLSVAADDLVFALYGSDFRPAGLALRIVIWVLPFMFLTHCFGTLGQVLGGERQVARINLIGAVFNLTANVVLIPMFGMVAAAVITILTELVMILQYYFFLRSRVAFGKTVAGWVRPSLASTVTGTLMILGHGLGLGPIMLGAFVTYFGLLVSMKALGGEELRFLGAAITRQLR